MSAEQALRRGTVGASFSSVIGHDQIKQELSAAIRDGHLSHAYLLEGMEGVGRKTLAGAFVAELFGDEESRRLLSHGNHPDVKYIRPQKDEKDSSKEKKSISVEQIRTELLDDISIRPYRGSHKVYIVEQADILTESAQNAMLKTLEEPPAYGIIILICEHASTLLPTILSRVAHLKLEPLGREQISAELVKRHVTQEAAQEAAVFSQGSLGKALTLSQDEDFRILSRDIFSFLSRVPELTRYEIVSGMTLFTTYKNQQEQLLRLMLLWQRDVIVYASSHDPDRLLLSSRAADIEKCALCADLKHHTEVAAALSRSMYLLSRNVQRDLVLEVMFSSYITDRNR